ncbi:MAG: tRNA pseudouridine(55) synthase TruB [Chlamydiales bacterium]
MTNSAQQNIEGLLVVNKGPLRSSFSLVSGLRKKLNVKKIGHAGTLDPFATGVMILLIGRNYTRLSDRFLKDDKEYRALLKLGEKTDTFDIDGMVTFTSNYVPTKADIQHVIDQFQGEIEQIPPMFSAKKVKGKKLYELARQGKEIERKPCKIHVKTKLIRYQYPFLEIHVLCSKGTYIRSLGHDIGELLGTGAHLASLERTRSGQFTLENALASHYIFSNDFNIEPYILK